jgi:hypothetical protein
MSLPAARACKLCALQVVHCTRVPLKHLKTNSVCFCAVMREMVQLGILVYVCFLPAAQYCNTWCSYIVPDLRRDIFSSDVEIGENIACSQDMGISSCSTSHSTPATNNAASTTMCLKVIILD